MYSFALAYYIYGEDIYADIEAPAALWPSEEAPTPDDAIGFFAESDLNVDDPDFPKGLLRMPQNELSAAQQEQMQALEFAVVNVDIGL